MHTCKCDDGAKVLKGKFEDTDFKIAIISKSVLTLSSCIRLRNISTNGIKVLTSLAAGVSVFR